ncbi:hypothetical protein E4T38_06540 [Aureobasidium subglaciale]|nr:hypothetical protein E4T38_06540 [Aureobasidium subglaciale]KAI5218984.1 hypothetical protein E4T40_06659 [Aureobasidium subglaciale]KAI5222713.1 hypothetical protein E4T41_06480 [Aureobasidium subglaciale]KAI5260264.1 hypothetical protein E4T46_06192 [Aureobasidium subglaciale]
MSHRRRRNAVSQHNPFLGRRAQTGQLLPHQMPFGEEPSSEDGAQESEDDDERQEEQEEEEDDDEAMSNMADDGGSDELVSPSPEAQEDRSSSNNNNVPAAPQAPAQQVRYVSPDRIRFPLSLARAGLVTYPSAPVVIVQTSEGPCTLTDGQYYWNAMGRPQCLRRGCLNNRGTGYAAEQSRDDHIGTHQVFQTPAYWQEASGTSQFRCRRRDGQS